MSKPKAKSPAENSANNSADRLSAYSFQKGQSGNPGGRKPIPPEVKELARAYSEEAIKTLATVMNDKKAPASARVMAANAIIDRAYGKPTQHIEAHVDLIDRLSHEEQQAFCERACGTGWRPGRSHGRKLGNATLMYARRHLSRNPHESGGGAAAIGVRRRDQLYELPRLHVRGNIPLIVEAAVGSREPEDCASGNDPKRASDNLFECIDQRAMTIRRQSL
jgi:hypothetical protein